MSIAPIISFIIILEENQEKYINKCLQSLLQQTYPNIEIIFIDNRLHHFPVVDECSHPAVKFIKNNTQKSYSDNKNKALELSKGQFIALVNIKDYLDSNFAQVVVSTFLEENADIVQVQSVCVDDQHNYLTQPYPALSAHYQNSKLSFVDIHAYKYLPNPKSKNTASLYINNIIFSKSFLVNNKLYYVSNSIYQDNILNYQAIRLSKKTVILPYVGYFYHQDHTFPNGDIDAAKLSHNYTELVTLIKKIYPSPCYKNKKEKAVFAKYLIDYLVSMIQSAKIDILEHINFLATNLYLSLVEHYKIIDKILDMNLFLQALEQVYAHIHVDLWSYLQKMLQTNLPKEQKLQYIHNLYSEKYTVTLLVVVDSSFNDNLMKCIFSIENQSYLYLEIIYLIDNNITSKQLDLLNSLQHRKSHIKILNIDNLLFKQLLDNISGTYLSFISSNTILHTHYVSLLILELNIKQYISAQVIVASYEQLVVPTSEINNTINSLTLPTAEHYAPIVAKYNISQQSSDNIMNVFNICNKIIPTSLCLKYINNNLAVKQINQHMLLAVFLSHNIQVFNFKYYLAYKLEEKQLSAEEQLHQLGSYIHALLANTDLIQNGLTHILPYILNMSAKLPFPYKTALIQEYVEQSIIEFSPLLHKCRINWAHIIKEFCVSNKIDYFDKMITTVPYHPQYKGGAINDIKQYIHNVEKKIFYRKNKNNGLLICEYFHNHTYMIEKLLLQENIPYGKIDLSTFETYKAQVEKNIIDKAHEFNIVITDYLSPLCKHLSPYQIIINLWRGTTLLNQRFPDADNPPSKLGYSTYNICSSEDEIQNISYAFATPKKNVLPFGQPKTDIYFDHNLIQAKKNLFFDKYPHFRNKKIYLFAPSFRKSKTPCINLNFTTIHNLLDHNEVLLIKEHPFACKPKMINKMFSYNFSRLKSKVFDATKEDLSTLVSIANVIITDFSSVIFDAILLNKPVVLYAEDIDKLLKPIPILFEYLNEFADNWINSPKENLFLNAIRNARIDYEKYHYLRKKYINCCDGNASRRLLEFVNNIMNEIS